MMYILDVKYRDAWKWTDVRDYKLSARPLFSNEKDIIRYLNSVAKIIGTTHD